jgi:hypothetical protein
MGYILGGLLALAVKSQANWDIDKMEATPLVDPR